MAISHIGSEVDIAVSSDAPPPWFTPKRLLGLFCVINVLIYIDRGAIASNGVNGAERTCNESGVCTPGSGIQGDFSLTNFQDGFLSSAFMVGLLVSSPLFASLAKSHNPFRLIGIGLLIFTVAAAGCGFSVGFWSITICRMIVGVSEASFINLGAPFIDDNAPPSQKTAWLAIFYMCIPVGIAFGYIYGGLIGAYTSWRFAFWGEAIMMLPFAILGCVLQPLQLRGFTSDVKNRLSSAVEDSSNQILEHPAGEESIGAPATSVIAPTNPNRVSKLTRTQDDLIVLMRNNIYVVNVLAYITYNFVIGAYAYWGPKVGYAIYKMENPDLIFGGITIICGIFGTLAGGLVLDLMRATIPNAIKLLSGSMFLGAVFCFSAFCSTSLYLFLLLFAVGEFLVCAVQGPVNYVFMNCVEPSLRPLALAMSTVAIHIFGDVPSSPLVGVLQDHINNWRVSAQVLTSVFFITAGTWMLGMFLPNREKNDEAPAAERSPLLDENSGASSEFP